MKFSQEALEIQNKNQDFLNAKLKYGLVSTFQVTDQQSQLNSARQNLISAKISYLNSVTRLYVDMGTLLTEWNIEVIY